MNNFNCKFSAIFVILFIFLFACHQEDPGPYQAGSRDFSVADFDRIEASDAMDVTMKQGTTFSIHAEGDVRDIDDLQVTKQGSTLTIRYNNGRNRQYTTYLTITLPTLKGLKFSGAVNGRSSEFSDTVSRFDISLSGASNCHLELKANEVYASISGASVAELTGGGKKIDADISGASTLKAFDFPVDEAKIVASGASHAKVKAAQQLSVDASGASEVRYRGEPQVDADVSGASWVGKD